MHTFKMLCFYYLINSLFSRKYRALHIEIMRSKILKNIENNTVVIVRGFSGCGKSTHVPQFILDKSLIKNTTCKIVIAQPRAVAAISVAERVCQERKCALGTDVGYQVNCVSLNFCS